MHPFSTAIFWCFQGVENGCIKNEWVNRELFIENIADENSFQIKHILLGSKKK